MSLSHIIPAHKLANDQILCCENCMISHLECYMRISHILHSNKCMFILICPAPMPIRHWKTLFITIVEL